MVGLAGNTSGTFFACGPVYVLIGLGRGGGATEEEELEEEDLVLMTDVFLLRAIESSSSTLELLGIGIESGR